MTALALRFLYIGLFSIGGGLSAISLIQAEIVDRLGWLTAETLVDLMAIAEMTPGPIAVNAASFVGMRLYGLPGAAAATCACVLPGCVICFLISRANDRLRKNRRWQSGLVLVSAALFCGGLAAYRRWRPSPMVFMLVMGTACGALRLACAQLL